MNTKIEYHYGDEITTAAMTECVIVEGEASDADIDAIIESLSQQKYFTPDDISFPVEDIYCATGDDCPICELFYEDFALVDDEPTELNIEGEYKTLDISEVVELFVNASDTGWRI